MAAPATDMVAHTYDVVVIGAGPVGENVTGRVGEGGLSAAVVERDLVGANAPTGEHADQGTAAQHGRAAGGPPAPSAREAVTGDLDVVAVPRRRVNG
ncbi:hypothetical protein [Streptomyces mexicanus]|jgi:dihydrolipoamide dehydrogenase|uniref:Uncharacterized protein n=1 Tax=Streptomyces mexicanus TaxID=178566 RepID=A0A7X1LQU7_9ACTN|nr:hypothetical protein [Streptomyces mexicanus]MBC2866363.1 hypothetical protein [Streptomyces mexicanus]